MISTIPFYTVPKPPPEPDQPPPIEDPMPPELPIEEPEPDPTVPVAAGLQMFKRPTLKIFTRALPLALVLAGCQQANVPEAPGAPENRRPEVNLTVDRDVDPAPLTVKLTAQGIDADGDALTYYWSITGEGFQGEDFEGDAVQDYTFADPGEYTVEVTASDGQLDSERDSVVILALSPDEPGL